MNNLNNKLNKKLNIIAFGDSLTFGYGIEKACTYTANLEKEFPNFNIYNKGENGHSTRDSIARFQKDVLDLNPNIVFIWLGSNDSAYVDGYHCSLIEYENNLRFMIEKLKLISENKNPIELILITPPPTIDELSLPFTDTKNICKYVDILCKLSIEYDIEIINLFSILLCKKKENPLDFTSYFQSDGLHLSLKSYELIYDLTTDSIKNAIKKILQ